jgi:hypothetical protein
VGYRPSALFAEGFSDVVFDFLFGVDAMHVEFVFFRGYEDCVRDYVNFVSLFFDNFLEVAEFRIFLV